MNNQGFRGGRGVGFNRGGYNQHQYNRNFSGPISGFNNQQTHNQNIGFQGNMGMSNNYGGFNNRGGMIGSPMRGGIGGMRGGRVGMNNMMPMGGMGMGNMGMNPMMAGMGGMGGMGGGMGMGMSPVNACCMMLAVVNVDDSYQAFKETNSIQECSTRGQDPILVEVIGNQHGAKRQRQE